MKKDTTLNEWKKRNGLTTEQASEVLGVRRQTVYTYSCTNKIDHKTQKIMDLVDEIREKDEKIKTLKKTINALS